MVVAAVAGRFADVRGFLCCTRPDAATRFAGFRDAGSSSVRATNQRGATAPVLNRKSIVIRLISALTVPEAQLADKSRAL